MALNLGYVGMGKQTTKDNHVAPTYFFRPVSDLPKLSARQEYVRVPGLDAMGNIQVLTVSRTGEGSLTAYVQAKSVGALLAAFFGAPNTTGSAPNYTHVFKPGTNNTYWTVEAQDGLGVHRLVGARASKLTFSHANSNILQVQADFVGLTKTLGGSPHTPTNEVDYFLPGTVTLSVDGVALAVRAENVEVSLSYERKPISALDSVDASDVEESAQGEVTASLTLVYDSVADAGFFTKYLNATPVPVSFAWAKDANTSLTIAFDAFISAEPERQNGALQQARFRLQLEAVRTGSNLVTVTLKNQQASY